MKSKEEKDKVRKFINRTFAELVSELPFKLHYTFEESKEKWNEDKGEFSIGTTMNNLEVTLIYYQNVFEYTEEKLRIALAHEVGHILVQNLNSLITQRYISPMEHHNILEETVTNIAFLLLKLVK